MAARMHPQLRHHLPDVVPEERDAQIYTFPADDWDRLARWARREFAKRDGAISVRDAALSRI